MRRYSIYGLIIFLIFCLTLLVGCNKQSSAPKEPVTTNQNNKTQGDLPTNTVQDSNKEKGNSATSVETKAPSDNRNNSQPLTGTENKTPEKNSTTGPVVEEEDCGC